MPIDSKPKRMGVFVDGDSVQYFAKQKLGRKLGSADINKLVQPYVDQPIEIDYYLEVSDRKGKQFAASLERNGIRVHVTDLTDSLVRAYREKSEESLWRDGLESLPKLGGLVLVCGHVDRLFVSLLVTAKKGGLETILLSFPQKASKNLLLGLDRFVNIEAAWSEQKVIGASEKAKRYHFKTLPAKGNLIESNEPGVAIAEASSPQKKSPPPGEITFTTAQGSYTSEKVLRQGLAARLYKVKASHELGYYALKWFFGPEARLSEKRLERFQRELRFGSRNRHKNIVSVLDYGFYPDGEGRTPFYVMNFYPDTLQGLIRQKISRDKILTYFSQMLGGIAAAHSQGVWHRDLKPENILYDSGIDELLIADFGIAHFHQKALQSALTDRSEKIANAQYAAPEQRQKGRAREIDGRADIYALGLILNEMFTGEVIQGTRYKRISEVAAEYAHLDDIVEHMVCQNPQARPKTIGEVKEMLALERHF